MFYYVLYRANLIPRYISILGIVGYPLSLLAAVFDMVGIIQTFQGPGVIMYLPGTIFELFLLPMWLMVRGFYPPVIDSSVNPADAPGSDL